MRSLLFGFSGSFYMPFIAFHQLLNLMGQCGKPMERSHLDQCFLKYKS